MAITHETGAERYSNKIKALIAGGVLSIALIAGGLGIGAYLTDMESVNNQFTFYTSTDYDKDGWLTEPNWDPEDGKEITPQTTVTKDPTITNATGTDSWMFLEVVMPTYFDETDGAVEYFTMNGLDTENFKQISKTEDKTAGTTTYVYSLKEAAVANGTSGTLFQSVTYKDMIGLGYADAEIDNADIKVTGYAGQAFDGINTAADAWSAIQTAQAGE